jgi:glycosyltransferase involved in cell wall biosynthesis
MARLAASPALVSALGERARSFAQGFTWEAAARETEEHLRAIARSP